VPPAPPGYTFTTHFNAFKPGPGAPDCAFMYHHNGIVGTWPFDKRVGLCRIAEISVFSLTDFSNLNPMINITRIDPVGGFIEGNFNEPMYSTPWPPPTKNVICNFRVRRQ
jgi:hypothetical protein